MIEKRKPQHPAGILLAVLGLFAMLGALGSLVLDANGALAPAAVIHLFFAVGLLPLILGAMAHFLPVLTRTAPRVQDLRPALLGLVAGAMAATGQQFWFPLIYGAAALGMVAGSDLLITAQRRARHCLGPPHPCLYWYQVALGCLIAALSALLLSLPFPQFWSAWRLIHLHFNLLGFVGITAVGTLQVLLPTAGGYSDPASSARLKGGLKWVAGGTLLAVAGSVGWRGLGAAGIILWLVPVIRLIWSLRLRLSELRHWHGAAVALAGALLGLTITLLLALWHGTTDQTGRLLLTALVGLFLLPLLSGALTQLVPVWLHPLHDDTRRQTWRRRIGWGAGGRVALFWLGSGLVLGGYAFGIALLAVGVMVFIGQVAVALVRPVEPGSTR